MPCPEIIPDRHSIGVQHDPPDVNIEHQRGRRTMTIQQQQDAFTGTYDDARHYDALLIVSFGGPEGMDDVMPFLETVLRGKNVPHERMLEVATHYALFGGVTPSNSH